MAECSAWCLLDESSDAADSRGMSVRRTAQVSIDLPDIVTIGALWGLFLWFREFRTARTVVLLAFATGILLVAERFPLAWELLIAAATVGVLLAIHFRFHRLISAYSHADLAFDEGLTGINDRLSRAYQRYEASGDAAYLRRALEDASREIEALPPAAAEWERVRSLAISLLGERISLMESPEGVNRKAVMRFRSIRAALHDELRLARIRTGALLAAVMCFCASAAPVTGARRRSPIVEAPAAWSLLRDADETGDGIERPIETHDLRHIAALHHGQMEGIPRSEPARLHVPLGTLNVRHLDGKDLVHYAEQRIERGLDRLAAINRNVPMQDLLEDLRIGHQAIFMSDRALQHSPREILVRVRGADQVHRYVGVHKDHGRRSVTYPRSISARRWSISGAGNAWLDAARMTASLCRTSGRDSARLAARSACRTHSATVTRCRRAAR